VNRQALLSPDRARARRAGQLVSPCTRIELELARIWEEILDVRPIGVRDNFFALGGHSLLAVRLAARIEQSFGRSLPLAELFRAGTIEELAQVLESGSAAPADTPLVTLRVGGDLAPLFCVHPVGGGGSGPRERRSPP
jgi:acyl carrier protein